MALAAVTFIAELLLSSRVNARAYGQYATRSNCEARVRAPVEPIERSQNLNSRGLIASVVSDAQRLVALEIALAKQELKDLATGNAIAIGVMAFGSLLTALAVLVALPSLVVWLVPWHWLAAAGWAAAYLVIGLLLLLIRRAP